MPRGPLLTAKVKEPQFIGYASFHNCMNGKSGIHMNCENFCIRVTGPHKNKISTALALIMCLLLFTGCGSGDGLNRKALSGKITLDGAPIPNGSISFEPLQTGGVSGGAVYTNGEYKIEQKDGLPPGKYRVTLTGDDGSNFGVGAGKMPGDEIMPARKDFIPAGWNESKQEIEVQDSGKNTFDFELKSKK